MFQQFAEHKKPPLCLWHSGGVICIQKLWYMPRNRGWTLCLQGYDIE